MKRSTVILLVVVAAVAVALWAAGLGLGLRAPRTVTPRMEWLEPRHVAASELTDRGGCLRRLAGRDAVHVPAGLACALHARPASFLSRRALGLELVSGKRLDLRVTPGDGDPLSGFLPDEDGARSGALPLDRSGATVVLTCTDGGAPGAACDALVR